MEADRDAAERDTTPSPFFGAMTDLAKVALTQAMSDPEKFKEFLTLFQNKRKPFDVSTLVSSLASSTSDASGAGSADDVDDGDAKPDAKPDNPRPAAPTLSMPTPPMPAPSGLQIAEGWTRLDPKSASVFVRRSSSWPRPTPVIARVQRVGDDIPVELGAELHVWSLEADARAGDLAQAPELANFGGAAKTAAGAAMAADKALRDAKWILLGDYYDYDMFPEVDSDMSGNEDAIGATPSIGSVDVDDSPKPTAKTRKLRP